MIHAKQITEARGNVGAPFKVGSDMCRWVERPGDIGLRFVGFADEIKPEAYGRRLVDHEGWYLDDDGMSGEVARGVVFQLPHGRYMYGMADPCNWPKRGVGPAIVALDVTDDECDAIRWADHVARVYAERERDYHRAANARLEHDGLAEDLAQQRREVLRLFALMRAEGAGAGPQRAAPPCRSSEGNFYCFFTDRAAGSRGLLPTGPDRVA